MLQPPVIIVDNDISYRGVCGLFFDQVRGPMMAVTNQPQSYRRSGGVFAADMFEPGNGAVFVKKRFGSSIVFQ